MAKHKIGWLNRPGTIGETWNPITGCTPVSEGCQNCYAARMAKRLAGRCGYPADEPFRVTFHRDKLEKPRTWKKPRTIFVCSMGDLWHETVIAYGREAVLAAASQAPQHTYIFCSKRPEHFDTDWQDHPSWWRSGIHPNWWLGVSAENQAMADKRIPLLLKTQAAIRWVSVEPMLGPVALPFREVCGGDLPWGNDMSNGLNWVVIGCESGPGRRPCRLEWVRLLVQQCQEAGVAVYVKQLDLDGRVSRDPAEWPEDVRVQQWPSSEHGGVT